MARQDDHIVLLKKCMLLKHPMKENEIKQYDDEFDQGLFVEVRGILEDIKKLQLEKAVLEDKVRARGLQRKQERISKQLKAFSAPCKKKRDSILGLWLEELKSSAVQPQITDTSGFNETRVEFINTKYKTCDETKGTTEYLIFTLKFGQFWTDIEIQASPLKSDKQSDLPCGEQEDSLSFTSHACSVTSSIFIDNLDDVIKSCLIQRKGLEQFKNELAMCVTQHLETVGT